MLTKVLLLFCIRCKVKVLAPVGAVHDRFTASLLSTAFEAESAGASGAWVSMVKVSDIAASDLLLNSS